MYSNQQTPRSNSDEEPIFPILLSLLRLRLTWNVTYVKILLYWSTQFLPLEGSPPTEVSAGQPTIFHILLGGKNGRGASGSLTDQLQHKTWVRIPPRRKKLLFIDFLDNAIRWQTREASLSSIPLCVAVRNRHISARESTKQARHPTGICKDVTNNQEAGNNTSHSFWFVVRLLDVSGRE